MHWRPFDILVDLAPPGKNAQGGGGGGGVEVWLRESQLAKNSQKRKTIEMGDCCEFLGSCLGFYLGLNLNEKRRAT